MTPGKGNSTSPVTLPLSQLLLVLLGFPALYIVNSLLPWSIGLFRWHDHAFFLQFWGSIAVLHWGSVAVVVFLLKRAGGQLTDIGLDLSPLKIAAMVGIPLVVGLTLTVLHEISGARHALPSGAQDPATTNERLFWIFMSFTAGFCEELVYRGFIIRVLQGRNIRTPLAVGVATLAFFFMHAPVIVIGNLAITLSSFLIICAFGLLFSALFLWRRSLLPGICLHGLIDVLNIGLPG